MNRQERGKTYAIDAMHATLRIRSSLPYRGVAAEGLEWQRGVEQKYLSAIVLSAYEKLLKEVTKN